MKRVLVFLLFLVSLIHGRTYSQELKIDRKIKREFFLSLRTNHFKKAEELIASGEVPVDFKNKFGQTPLYYAVDSDDVEFARFLINHGANVNATDYFGFTPLHEAIVRGSYGVAKLLIKNGANVNSKDQYGYTPLHLVCISSLLSSGILQFSLSVGEKIREGSLSLSISPVGVLPPLASLVKNPFTLPLFPYDLNVSSNPPPLIFPPHID